jgi:hypothetical protein
MAIFRGSSSLRGILWFFLGFTPFYATITGATLVKMRLHKLSKVKAKVQEVLPSVTLNNKNNKSLNDESLNDEISESL